MTVSESLPETPGGQSAGTMPVPPPECPAHAAFAGGAKLTALYGEQAQKDPNGLYEKLRAEHGTVAPVELEGGVGAWLVLGYRENMEASRNAARFAHDSRLWTDWKQGRIGPEHPMAQIFGWRPDCTFADGDEHQRLRSAVGDCLAKFDRHGIRRHVQRYANQLIDEFVESGKADLVTQFVQDLPMLVFTRLIGLDEESGAKLIEATAGLVNGGENAVECNQFIVKTLQDLTVARRQTPAYDLASWFVQHPSGLTDDEVLGHLRVVLVLGNETTTSLISSTLRMVLTDPRFRASLTGGLMTLPDAVEQMLWDEPPLLVCPARFATHDTQLGGKDIREGDLLLLGLAAGNADPEVRPDLAAPMRGNRSHLAFSRGPHECPGQEIGRAITDTGVDVLLNRLPDLRLTVPQEQLSWTSTTWSRHLDELPVQFAPQRRQAPQPARESAGARVAAQRSAPAPELTAAADATAAIAEVHAAAAAEERGRGLRSVLARLFGTRR